MQTINRSATRSHIWLLPTNNGDGKTKKIALPSLVKLQPAMTNPHISALILIFFALLSCNEETEKIVNPWQYKKHVTLAMSNKSLHDCRENISFWKSRFEKNQKDQTSLTKLASLYAESFRITGNIEEIFLSDSLFDLVHQSNFSSAAIYRNLAANCISRHEFWQAKNYAQKALLIGENKSSSLLMLTDIHLEVGNTDSARAILNSFKNKNSFAVLIRRSKVLDHTGDLDSAIILMEQATQLVQSNQSLYCWAKSNLGDMYGHAGRVKDAYLSYLDVLEHQPDYECALKGIAWIAFSNDRNIDEASDLLHFLMGQKNSPDYHLMLAEMAQFRNNKAEKEKHLRKFTEIVSLRKFGNMYNRQLALIYCENEETVKKAVDLARKEVKVRPTAESYDLLAWTLFKNHQLEEAVSIVHQYVIGKSHEPEVLFHSGMILRSTNEEKSIDLLKAALESPFEIGPTKTLEITRTLSRQAI
jgi:tetratricopeptide (TPR) repeat protein